MDNSFVFFKKGQDSKLPELWFLSCSNCSRPFRKLCWYLIYCGFFFLLLLSSAVLEPDDCPNKDPCKAFSFYWACRATIQYCIVPAEVAALCKKGMLFSGHVSDAPVLLVGRVLCLSPFASPNPKPPRPPCLEQVRVGYLDLALLTGKWCQHISARFSKRGIRPTVDKLPYVKVGWHSRKLRDGSILQGQEICLLGPSAPCKQPWLLPFSVVLHLLNTLILVGITWQNELPLFFGLDLIQIERETVNFHVGCAHLVFQFAGWTEKSEKKCKGDLRRFFPPHFLSGMKKGKIETNKSSNTKMKC